MGFFDMVGDGTKWLNDRFNEAENWAENVWHGNVGTQAVPAPELVQKILASPGASGWHEGAGKATELANDHDTVSTDVRNLSTGLESVWTGDGAEAAQQRIRLFSDATAAASQTYTTNGENLTGLAHGFDDMKAALQPMPGTPPHKGFIDVATPWDTDTEDKINQYNQLAQQNLDRYNGYAQQAQTSGQGLKTDYGKLDEFDGTVTITKPGKTTREKHVRTEETGTGKNTTDKTGTTTTTTTDSRTNLPGVDDRHTTTPPPTVERPIGIIEPPGFFGRPPEQHRPPGDVDHPGDTSDDDTHTSSDLPTSLPEQWPGFTPPVTSSPGGDGSSSWSPGLAGGFGTGAGAGAGGAAGRGISGGAGRGFGSGAGGSRFSGGSGSGTGALEEGARGGLAGKGATGAAGTRGAAGMGGMGAAGGRGKGEEDAEHQRKYGVDDDSAFSLTDDDGGRLVDPHTGLPPTPPTIGA